MRPICNLCDFFPDLVNVSFGEMSVNMFLHTKTRTCRTIFWVAIIDTLSDGILGGNYLLEGVITEISGEHSTDGADGNHIDGFPPAFFIQGSQESILLKQP